MKTFEEMKKEVTTDFIKKLVELAEGFEWGDGNHSCKFIVSYDYVETLFDDDIFDRGYFPLLLHRAVEGWNKSHKHKNIYICITDVFIRIIGQPNRDYGFYYYQPCHLTQCEMAILDCLIEVLK